MKTANKFNASQTLQNLFVELVKIELSNYKRVTLNMVANTIKFYSEMAGFNKYASEYWQTVCSANGVKYSI